MKKTLFLLFVLLMAVSATACGNSVNNSESKEAPVVIQITSHSQDTTADEKNEKIEEEIIKKATRPNQNTTEPTDATESKIKTKKKKSKNLPTQGDVNPNVNNIQVTTEPNGSFEESDLDFIFEGAYIYLNDDMDDALAILGDDNSATELSKTKTEYEYDNLTVISYEKSGKEKVEQITVTTDKLSTPKGAKVGMYATKLRTVYGIPAKKTEDAYTYTKGNKSLVFNIENNIVTSYSYVLDR